MLYQSEYIQVEIVDQKMRISFFQPQAQSMF